MRFVHLTQQTSRPQAQTRSNKSRHPYQLGLYKHIRIGVVPLLLPISTLSLKRAKRTLPAYERLAQVITFVRLAQKLGKRIPVTAVASQTRLRKGGSVWV
ncbi:hypothetical protein AUEXF2481DRAFT_177113 [Aureobasidium subglaciale EXF-2481]|uniref:Uncharacterized protein n=1 Tax=Aureobasidium subglaciale (strain EXF-2481) TaxID=1043005 RepID=A0A074YNQ5_AURSE|nr:uncharacterized protein AUEXF2481DRAFT_177113 [Aureobasidium subglaciale EXF-2481]KEQ99438.1 hypothetical protein AUEXF2481DRAFT_177113 [Aureobasidium subglaciale EXF-2481]